MVRAPRSHRGGRRFDPSIAHHAVWDAKSRGGQPDSLVPRWRNGRRAAFRAQCPYGCVGSNPSLGTNKVNSTQPSAPRRRSRISDGRPLIVDRFPALVAQRIRALACGARGRGFESRQAHHFFLLAQILIHLPPARSSTKRSVVTPLPGGWPFSRPPMRFGAPATSIKPVPESR